MLKQETKMHRFLTTEPSNPWTSSALTTALLYMCMLVARLVFSAQLFQTGDFLFIPLAFISALATRLLTARGKRKVS
ncbi:hypothetical protein ACIBKX_40610 [Streptomyces sp. NPDC050658]|uniref:hypothetical protein n=1 Tax=unclassified Streptomyces TaxID=2593676 RepID=UPI003433A172